MRSFIIASLGLLAVTLFIKAADLEAFDLSWEYATPSTNIAFNVYTSTNTTGPWAVVQTVPGTTKSNYVTVVMPERRATFYLVRALHAQTNVTEAWMLSDPSDAVSVKVTGAAKHTTITR
jgi:hypothetical protein